MSGDVHNYVKLALEPYMFRESEVELFNAIQGHLLKYGKIPAFSTLEQLGFSDALAEAPEPPEYYLDEVNKRYLRTSLKKMVADAHQLLMDEDEGKAYDLVLEAVASLHKQKNHKNLFDFRDAEKIIKQEYVKTKLMGVEMGLTFGWTRLDKMTGGLRGGDVCSIVGRPASGKTFKLLYVSRHSWNQGNRPLFISMEMNTAIITQRLAGMETGTPLTQLIKAELSKTASKSMMTKLKALHDKQNPFWIVDGNLTATVDDIILLCQQLKPTSVLIDGAYLLKHPNAKISKLDRLNENAEAMKQKIAQGMDIPMVVSYQFNRESVKKTKEKQKVGVEDIYGTDAVGQLSSVVLGLFEEEGIETQKRRKVTILKGRNGEKGGFMINWDFQKMDFSQIIEAEDIDGDEEHDPSLYADNELEFLG